MSRTSNSYDSNARTALIVIENSSFLGDPRVKNEASSLRDAGWKVLVLCAFRKDLEGDRVTSANFWQPHNRDGIIVHYFPLPYAEEGFLSYLMEYLTAYYWIARRTWEIWRRDRFKVIHFCNPPDIFFPIGFLYRLLGAKVIFDHHDLFPELISVRFGGTRRLFLYWFARLMEFLTFRVAHVVITTNQSFCAIAEQRGMYPSERIFIVRNGPVLAKFAPLDPDPTLKRGFDKMVVYAGVMGYQDGVLELFDSIRYLLEDRNRRDILFVLLGDGAVRPIAMERSRLWGDNCIQMPGMIRDKYLLRQYLSTADVLVSPEPYNELNNHSTFIKVVEYLAMGKPIVAYDLKETRYTAGGAALYIRPGDARAFGDAILKLVDQPELGAQFVRCARERIKEISWETQQSLLLSAYETAIGDKK